jgi:hypothetical protein
MEEPRKKVMFCPQSKPAFVTKEHIAAKHSIQLRCFHLLFGQAVLSCNDRSYLAASCLSKGQILAISWSDFAPCRYVAKAGRADPPPLGAPAEPDKISRSR